MRFPSLAIVLHPNTALLLLGTAMVACGGGGGMMTQVPIAISLPVSTITVQTNGVPVIAQIQISSTSETALVALSGLPSGVSVKYAASDTNPSGTLTFNASMSAMTGTFMPIISVNSAGQMTSKSFTLIVK